MNEIVRKWVVEYKHHHLCITEKNEVYDMETKEQLIECWNNGTIAYRYPGTSTKIGVKTLRNNCIRKTIILQEFCPF